MQLQGSRNQNTMPQAADGRFAAPQNVPRAPYYPQPPMGGAPSHDGSPQWQSPAGYAYAPVNPQPQGPEQPQGAGQPQPPKKPSVMGGGGNKRPQVERRKRKKNRLLLWLIVCVLALGGGAVGIVYYSKTSTVAPYTATYLPNISVDGILLTGMTRQEAQTLVNESVARRQNSFSLSLTHQGHTFYTLDYAALGVTTSQEQVNELLDQAYQPGHSGNLFEDAQTVEEMRQTQLALYTTPTEMTDANVEAVLAQIAAYFEKAPMNAYLVSFNPDLSDPFTIEPEVYGATFDVEEAKRQIMERAAKGESGTLELEPTPIAPAVTTADIRGQVTLLSEAVTAISRSSEEPRTDNIRLSSAKINGTVLKPGDTFSFNTVVGKRTIANGFKEAPEYAYGELVPGIGGGVCQTSTTVYIAAVTANLQITKRQKHSVPVNYTEGGQDATVADGRIDFKFRNNTEGNVYITAHVTLVSGTKNRYQCVVRIYGISLGENVQYKLRSVTTQTLKPGEPTYKKDKDAKYVTYTDETYKTTSARDGSIVDTYLQRWENGLLVSEELITTDRYEPRSEVYYVGVTNRV